MTYNYRIYANNKYFYLFFSKIYRHNYFILSAIIPK